MIPLPKSGEECEIPIVHKLQKALALSRVRSKLVVKMVLLVKIDTKYGKNKYELLEHLGAIYMQLVHMR